LSDIIVGNHTQLHILQSATGLNELMPHLHD